MASYEKAKKGVEAAAKSMRRSRKGTAPSRKALGVKPSKKKTDNWYTRLTAKLSAFRGKDTLATKSKEKQLKSSLTDAEIRKLRGNK